MQSYYFFEIDSKRYVYPADKVMLEYNVTKKFITIYELNTTYRKFTIYNSNLYYTNNLQDILTWIQKGN